MLAVFLALFAFYLGGAVASALFTYRNVKVFGMVGMLPGGHGVAFVVAKIALCWPVDAPKFAFPRMPKADTPGKPTARRSATKSARSVGDVMRMLMGCAASAARGECGAGTGDFAPGPGKN